MTRLSLLLLFLLAGPAFGQPPVDVKPEPAKFQRGLRPTPLAKILEALRTGMAVPYASVKAPPAEFAAVPPKTSPWGNDRYGDCVSAENAYAIGAFSFSVTGTQIYITEQTLVAWASAHGFLNGADLLEVIQAMQRDGIKDENGVLRKEGTPSVVDYSNEQQLQSAIATGPVSIAIDANALPSGAGNATGWWTVATGNFGNTDHCVSLSGYGTAKFLFGKLGVPLPAGLAADTKGYLLFTWNTIGFVTHGWLRGTCREAWLRTPTVVGLSPPPPANPVVVTVADATGAPGNMLAFFPIITGGVGPYSIAYDYGDGTTGTSNQHAYVSAGTYTVTVTATDSKQVSGKGQCKATISQVPVPPGPNPAPPYPFVVIDKPGKFYFVSEAEFKIIKSKADTLDSIRDLLVPGGKPAPMATPIAEPPAAKPDSAALDVLRGEVKELRARLEAKPSVAAIEVVPGARVFGADGFWQPLEKYLKLK